MQNIDPEQAGHDEDVATDGIALDEAFNKLSGRISVLTIAFDKFADRQEDLVGRDYSVDLGKIEKDWKETRQELRNLAAQPVLALTPDRVAEQIEIAGRRVREPTMISGIGRKIASTKLLDRWSSS